MKTLYYSRGACSFAVHIVLEELGEQFEAKRLDATKGENRTDAYLKLHPRGHVPVYIEDEFVLTEAAAILVHLADTHPASKLIPAPGTRERAKVHEWCGFLASAVHIALRQIIRPERLTREDQSHPGVQSSGHEALGRFFKEIEGKLIGPWALGEQFTIVDPYLTFFHRMGHRVGHDMSQYPRWVKHAEAMLARPAVQRTMEREEITLTGLKK